MKRKGYLNFSGKLAVIFTLLVGLIIMGQSNIEKPIYLNPDQPIEKRVEDLLTRMTLEEKVSQMGNDAPAINRLEIPAYDWWNECLHGVARAGTATVFPQAIGMAATWDPDLIFKVASATSDEARAKYKKGENGLTFWSPVVNIARDPRWGRTQEGYGEDPYLVSRIGVAFVKGLQGNDPEYLKIVSTPKHFIANNEEWRRHSGSAQIGERLLREYYLPAFKTCVEEGKAQSIMGAYNAVNGVPCCCEKKLLTDILRNEFGFDGYVVSDCWAIFDIYLNHHFVRTAEEAVALAVKAGCDLNCGDTYQDYLVKAVKDGLISEEIIDRAVGRLFKARFRLGMFDPSEKVSYNKISSEVIDSKEHRELALKTACESIVLLKNKGNLLPFDRDKIESIAVIGPNANVCQFGNYSGTPSKAVTPLEGIKNRATPKTSVYYAKGCEIPLGPFPSIQVENLIPPGAKKGQHGLKGEYFTNNSLYGKPALVRIDKEVNFDWSWGPPDKKIPGDNFSVRWTGKLVPPVSKTYRLSVIAQGLFRLFLDDSLLIDNLNGQAITAEDITSREVISIELKAGHPYDIRMEYCEDRGVSLVSLGWDFVPAKDIEEAIKVAKKSDVAIVVVGTNLGIERESRDRANLDLPGFQKDLIKKISRANPKTAVVLINGSPLAINWTKEKVPAIIEVWFPGEEGGNAIADVLFGNYNPGGRLPLTFYKSVDQLPPFHCYNIREGRTYMYLKEEPLFPFGYGLSYTKFEYSNLQIKPKKLKLGSKVNISVDIKNVGTRKGEEVVQLYLKDVVSSVIRPDKELKGFKRINLKPGERRKISFALPVKELSFYDIKRKKFVVEAGTFEAMIGSSSEDIRLKDNFEVTENSK